MEHLQVKRGRIEIIGEDRITVLVQIWREGNQVIADAMPLDVMSSGNTPEEARKALG